MKIIFLAKLLVTTGQVLDNHATSRISEVLDLSDPTNKCQMLQKYPIKVMKATGKLIDGEVPLICGGIGLNGEWRRECYTVKENTNFDKPAFIMNTTRKQPSSISVPDGILISGFETSTIGRPIFILNQTNKAKSLIGLISHYKLIWVVGCVIRQMLRYILLKSIGQITRLKKNFTQNLNISRTLFIYHVKLDF